MSAILVNNSDPRGGDFIGMYAVNGGQFSGNRSRLINGAFAHNQRVVSGTVTLTAGQYGHDYWKAGSSGCTYIFTTINNLTTITITAGTLLQVINGKNLFSGIHVLSWGGTAVGRVGAGAYSAPGANIITANITGGVNTTIEFAAGTLWLTQFEPGIQPTVFEFRLNELLLCQQRFFKTYDQAFPVGATNNPNAAPTVTAMAACNYATIPVPFQVVMEDIPACYVYGRDDGVLGRMQRDSTWISANVVSISQRGCVVRALNQPVVTDNFLSAHVVAIAGL
ncbi:hypothetical protein UFOVP580_12 [uncultured Caudovirales phage]|uniref:Uncharacterized protein n=1 Tax=uncultured Caudovirales phage TaxID=2100421 RepID=A0A6J5PGN3_9CAUD|nr:hypothetical protein UFOVP580_12 [uncultured Caudovirales phage]